MSGCCAASPAAAWHRAFSQPWQEAGCGEVTQATGVQVLDIEPSTPGPKQLAYDAQWLAILRETHDLLRPGSFTRLPASWTGARAQSCRCVPWALGEAAVLGHVPRQLADTAAWQPSAMRSVRRMR